MAFVQKAGSRFAVKKGNSGKTLSTFGSKKKAIEERDRLHRKNMPKASNRGKSARKREGK